LITVNEHGEKTQEKQDGASQREHDVRGSDLERLHRERIFSRKAEDPESRWITLPNFEITIPAPPSEALLRGFLRTMLSVSVRGVTEVFQGALTEIQFVMMCKLTKQEGSLTFSAYTPFQGLVLFAQNHLPPRMKGEELSRVMEAMNLDIQHRYAVPIDCLVPVVVVYRAEKRHILLTNKNHITNPRQFLNPRICHTTSGFLSFLGTFMLEFESSKAQTFYVEGIESLLSENLDQWFRWFYNMRDKAEWDIQRIFVNAQNPEEYIYDYSG
jgi:hypothetical protein